ncbi:hypothetical protein FQN54_009572 [Arachnomyces sp. PD_36]|nr:hypothetical protein FQN54_009572 [Arachnomyces sp. PD_36]
MAQLPSNIPTAPGRWRELASKKRVESKTVFELPDFNSGSKIEDKQFLTLHVLWKSRNSTEFKPQNWGFSGFKGLEQLPKDNHLDSNKNWKDYTEMSGERTKGSPHLGTFDMLWEYQRIVDGLRVNGPELNKVRDQDYLYSPSAAAKARKDGLGGLTEEMEVVSLNDDSEDSETTPQDVMHQLFSPVAPGDTDEYGSFNNVDDEQIVNTALILLLQGICLRAPQVEKTEWTLQRKAFDFATNTADNESIKLFQARTDGHLRIAMEEGKESRSLAILEVKAKMRNAAEPYMQESAQMAAWIHAEPDVRNKSDTYRRVMICQDHREIYLNIAEYNWDYLLYIRDGVKPANGPSFLTMNQFGPFIPDRTGHMRALGSIFLALTQQLEKEAINGEPCRW